MEEAQEWVKQKTTSRMGDNRSDIGKREEMEAWKVIENIKVNGNQPDGPFILTEEKATEKAMDTARKDMGADG